MNNFKIIVDLFAKASFCFLFGTVLHVSEVNITDAFDNYKKKKKKKKKKNIL